MDSEDKFKVIGLMSGTSLDGLDIACCLIRKREGQWVYAIECSQTVTYSRRWIEKLRNAPSLSGEALLRLHVEYGRYLGVLVDAFVMKNKIKNIDFVASHGHTVFHQPHVGLTYQIGEGNSLYAACGIPVVCDFRSLDVALGGQGAPLVPIGDALLFHEYDACLNLGGIANVSLKESNKRVAFDICFVNMALNYLSSLQGKAFDKDGELASKGEIDKSLLKRIMNLNNKLTKKRPSLGYEIFVKELKPLLDNNKSSVADKLATVVESSAVAIGASLSNRRKALNVLCTGGGAYNSFFIYRLIENCPDNISIVIPDDDIVKYKEALIFSFLGVLKVRGEYNSLKSVTGASTDSSCGYMIGFK